MKELVNQDVECTLFKTAFNTALSAPVALSSYIGCVAGGKYEKEVTCVRNLVAAGDKKQGNARKRNLPLLVAGGRMEGGRKLENLVSYSACVVADIDDAPGSPSGLLLQARELSYVKAGHVSPSGTGLKLFVLVDSDLAHHGQAFELVSRRLSADLPGCVVDPSGKDPNRGCFVSYDPGAFFKEEADVLNIPINPDATAPRVAPSADSLGNYIDKYETGNTFADGSRHSYIVKLASALNSAGFDEADASRECVRRYAAPGFDQQEIRITVADIYRRYQSAHASVASVSSVTPFPRNDGSEEGSPLGLDIEDERPYFPHFDQALLEGLPSLLADAVRGTVDDTEHDLMMLGTITAISTALPRVTGMMNGDVYYAPLYALLIGPSGSGKGCISKVRKIVEPWQTYVADNSRHAVETYKIQKEACEMYKLKQRQSRSSAPAGLPPQEPTPVTQKQLHISGYTTTARLSELLEANAPYASLLFETELESVNNTMAQDFGGYGYILNQAFQHECVSSSSKTNGSFMATCPQLGLLATGTPGMLLKLVPSTENGLYSRLLIYRIVGASKYHDLKSYDTNPAHARLFDDLGQRLLDISIFLDSSPTFVSFSDAQRKKIDRYFRREYYNVRVFGTDDVASVVLRHRLMIFRIAMVLTALRKGEARLDDRKMEISDADFEAAFHIGTLCLQHTLMVSTTMKHSNSTSPFKLASAQHDLFVAMPDRFRTSEVLAEASVRGICRSSVFRMLKKAQEYGLLVSLGAGYYEKTESGKNL